MRSLDTEKLAAYILRSVKGVFIQDAILSVRLSAHAFVTQPITERRWHKSPMSLLFSCKHYKRCWPRAHSTCRRPSKTLAVSSCAVGGLSRSS